MTSQTVGAVSEQDMVLNRQINFLIMRKMWQDIRGRAKRGEAGKETIYHAFDMSRERYTRAINGEPVRFSQKELRDLMLKTGVNSDIFQGVTCFQFEAITRKDWEKLFVLRGEDIQRPEPLKEICTSRSQRKTWTWLRTLICIGWQFICGQVRP